MKIYFLFDISEYNIENALELDLRHANIPSFKKIEYFKNLRKISCGNKLCRLVLPDHLNMLTHLHTLLLPKCNLSTFTITLPKSMQIINISDNFFTSLPNFAQLGATELTEINCNNNQLTELPDTYFSNFSKLKKFFCSRNRLTHLPLFSTLSQSFHHLNCDHNEITEIPEFPSTLQYFSCTHNKLTRIPFLSNKFVFFSCKDNALTEFPEGIETCIHLFNFNCSNNRLSSIAEGIVHCKSLKFFYCENNKLQYMPLLPENLTGLFCRNNQLETLGNSLSLALHSLQELNCGKNKLTELPSPLPSPLIKLDCEENRLLHLPPLPLSIYEVNCERNFLKELPSIAHLSKLRRLNCKNNALRALPIVSWNLHFLVFKGNAILNAYLTDNEIYLPFQPRLVDCIRRFHRFKYTFYLFKCKRRFLRWLLKTRELQIREQFHPKHLWSFLKQIENGDGGDLDAFLNGNWGDK